MLKVLVACGCGMGSSQLLKMSCSTVMTKLGIDHDIHHCAIDEAKSTYKEYDLVVIGENFLDAFDTNAGTTIIGLKNLMNKKELAAKLRELGLAK